MPTTIEIVVHNLWRIGGGDFLLIGISFRGNTYCLQSLMANLFDDNITMLGNFSGSDGKLFELSLYRRVYIVNLQVGLLFLVNKLLVEFQDLA